MKKKNEWKKEMQAYLSFTETAIEMQLSAWFANLQENTVLNPKLTKTPTKMSFPSGFYHAVVLRFSFCDIPASAFIAFAYTWWAKFF